MHGATVRHNAALALLRLCADPSGGSPSLPTRFLPVETRRKPHGQTLTLRAMAELASERLASSTLEGAGGVRQELTKLLGEQRWPWTAEVMAEPPLFEPL